MRVSTVAPAGRRATLRGFGRAGRGGEVTMDVEGKQCPECRTTLKPVLLSDLVGEPAAGGLNATLPAAGAVFDYFDFWVCTRCGRTLLYADERARAKAEGREVPHGGGVLGLS
jgi:hypothetical protein